MSVVLIERLDLGVRYAWFNIKPAAWIGVIGHPVYWAIWAFIFTDHQDNAFLRFTSAFLCIGVLFYQAFFDIENKYFKYYWAFVVAFSLPFLFTFLLLLNGFSALWLASHVAAVLVVVLLVYEIIWFNFIVVSSNVLGVCFFLLCGYEIKLENFMPEYVLVFAFVMFAGSVFSHLGSQGIAKMVREVVLNGEKAETYRSLSGSIAHEVRNPIAMAGQALSLFDSQLDRLKRQVAVGDLQGVEQRLNRLSDISAMAHESLHRGDVVIDMILANIRDQEMNPEAFEHCSMAQVVRDAMGEYVFKPGERESIDLNLEDDFSARIDPAVMNYVLFNLLKNALHYLPNKPKSRISIELLCCDDGFNRLVFADTGPGIPADRLPGLFESFSTAGKKRGTGLGLSFCKRSMLAFGGDIDCASREGEFTRFTLTFPKMHV